MRYQLRHSVGPVLGACSVLNGQDLQTSDPPSKLHHPCVEQGAILTVSLPLSTSGTYETLDVCVGKMCLHVLGTF